MPVFRARLTVRGLGIAVALIALNLAGAIATARSYPRPIFLPVLVNKHGDGLQLIREGDGAYAISNRRVAGGLCVDRTDGSRTLYAGDINDPRPLEHRPHLVIRPPRPTLLRIWAPVLAGASITLLTLTLALRDPPRPPRFGPPDRPGPAMRLSPRGLVIALALASLNLAAAVVTTGSYPRPIFVPPSVSNGLNWSRRARIVTEADGTLAIHDASVPGRTLVIRSDGSHSLYEDSPQSNDPTRRPRASAGGTQPPARGDSTDPRPLGRPPYLVIRPPRPTLLRIWAPVASSVAASLMILSVLARRSPLRPRIDTSTP